MSDASNDQNDLGTNNVANQMPSGQAVESLAQQRAATTTNVTEREILNIYRLEPMAESHDPVGITRHIREWLSKPHGRLGMPVLLQQNANSIS